MEVGQISEKIRICGFQTYYGGYRTYFCSIKETCCKGGCCFSKNPFYQIWYFWLGLLLFFTLMYGAGMWFRWCHGSRNNSTTWSERRQVRGRGQRPHNREQVARPVKEEKGPPSYNEVISQLNRYPLACFNNKEESGCIPETSVPEPSGCQGGSCTNQPSISAVAPDNPDPWMGLCPPSYESLENMKLRASEPPKAEASCSSPPELSRGSMTATQKIRSFLNRTGILNPEPDPEAPGPFIISRNNNSPPMYVEDAPEYPGFSSSERLTSPPEAGDVDAPSSSSSCQRSLTSSRDVDPVSQKENLAQASRCHPGLSALSRSEAGMSLPSTPDEDQSSRRTSIPGTVTSLDHGS